VLGFDAVSTQPVLVKLPHTEAAWRVEAAMYTMLWSDVTRPPPYTVGPVKAVDFASTQNAAAMTTNNGEHWFLFYIADLRQVVSKQYTV
jgi:hypothetical protein